jgi:lactobin A/cerein 7B family class IIb bacteriocin
MQELKFDQVEDVNGGLPPLLVFVVKIVLADVALIGALSVAATALSKD